jgi:predicted nucleic acid-binding protein
MEGATAKRRLGRPKRGCRRCPWRSSAWIENGASRAGALKQKHSVGYADAFAAELAIERGAWLVTADPEFSKVGKTLAVYSLPRHEK